MLVKIYEPTISFALLYKACVSVSAPAEVNVEDIPVAIYVPATPPVPPEIVLISTTSFVDNFVKANFVDNKNLI